VFQGALVNLKNVSSHKSVLLHIEVPEEYGAALVAAFGWPTRVKPVSVAVARLEGEAARQSEKKAEPRRFAELTPAEQSGILCREPEFAEFLRHECQREGRPEEAVRYICGVRSRSEIAVDTPAGRNWDFLLQNYRRWQDERNRLDIDF
jgi:hypothetical protein